MSEQVVELVEDNESRARVMYCGDSPQELENLRNMTVGHGNIHIVNVPLDTNMFNNSAKIRQIAGALVVAFLGPSTKSLVNSIGAMMEDYDRWNRTFPIEWKFTNLHHHLAMLSGPAKEACVQQRRKALAKVHEQRRIKKGRSHAKQKHKGMERRC